MRLVIVTAAAALLAGCATGPGPTVISYDGEFRGAVVARNDVPLSARYTGMCESPPKRWAHGWYRTYSCAPVTAPATVRAKY
ncbi:hypothetical protein [Alsobacter sp. R-9]